MKSVSYILWRFIKTIPAEIFAFFAPVVVTGVKLDEDREVVPFFEKLPGGYFSERQVWSVPSHRALGHPAARSGQFLLGEG